MVEPPQRPSLTADLLAVEAGDPEALSRLVAALYQDLRRLARAQLRGHRAATLDTGGLVHEAFLRLIDQSSITVESRAHFLSLCARVMRQVMIDAARARLAAKRGAGARADLPVDELAGPSAEQAEWLIDLHAAVERLAERDERLVNIIECRLFAGLTNEEAALALGLAPRTAERDWQRARAWLRAELG